jgi:threonine/homoserine/homoserine lactone efflux protein
MNLLPELPQLSAFLVASVVLAVTPGPGVAYIVARSLVQGRVGGFASMLGVALGNFVNAIAAALGLAALFAVSALAFTVVKWVGAIYLMALGVQLLWQARKTVAVTRDVNDALVPVSSATLIRDGFVVSLLNPKTTIFFAAFLPQFMRADAPQLPQAIVLGAMFVAIAAVTDTVYTLLAGWIAPKLKRGGAKGGQLGKLALGTVFIGMGVLTAMTSAKSK